MSRRGCKYRNKIEYANATDADHAAKDLNKKWSYRLRHHSYACGDHWHVATNTTRYRHDKAKP